MAALIGTRLGEFFELILLCESMAQLSAAFRMESRILVISPGPFTISKKHLLPLRSFQSLPRRSFSLESSFVKQSWPLYSTTRILPFLSLAAKFG
jgi:hypothetical protein